MRARRIISENKEGNSDAEINSFTRDTSKRIWMGFVKSQVVQEHHHFFK